MKLPTSTYRLQFRNGMTFERAIALVPHLTRLNISHLYCSPIFAATRGSTHGYDVTDPNLIEPDIGGGEGFDQLANALKAADIGLILDIVPNHLAASLENPWWRSVVEWGADSRFARHFDIDWSQKLTLPFLTAPLAEVLAGSDAGLGFDWEQGALTFQFLGSNYPLHPASYAGALEGLEGETPERIRALAAGGDAQSEDAFHAEMRALIGNVDDLNAALRTLATPERLRAVLDLQPWRPIPWQEAASGLNYRRFFEITGLAGVRVEDPAVFEDMHRTVLDLVHKGVVDGLRIDHIDGLADPEAYLAELRERCGPDTYIVVEKILEHDEQLPSSWPIQGTTGYEFVATLADVMIGPESDALDAAYRRVAGKEYVPEDDFDSARRLTIEVNFEGEVKALERMVVETAECEEEGSGPDPEALRKAVRDLLAAFPVYRTYGSERGLKSQDAQVLLKIFEGLYRTASPAEASALRRLQSILRGEVSEASAGEAVR